MNELILSGLLNLFALFGALAGKDAKQSRKVVENYLSRHFGIRGREDYMGLYDDLCALYSENPQLDKDTIISGICSKLQHKIRWEEQALLLLRFMEFCNQGDKENQRTQADELFRKVAALFSIPDELYADFAAYIKGEENDHILLLQIEGLDGYLKIMEISLFNKTVFTYCGNEEIFLNDVPVLPDIFMVWQHSGILKTKSARSIYYSNVSEAFKTKLQGKGKHSVPIELAGRGIEFRFPNSDNGIHNFTFTLHKDELVAIMGGSGVGKSTLLSLLTGSMAPDKGSVTLNGYGICDSKVKDLIGFVPQDDLLIEELTVYQNLWYTAKFCFDGMDAKELDAKVMSVLNDLGLLQQKDLKVGGVINKFISGGQRKRLNIALELIREPAVLFLDEPTSGLSSSDSEKVMNLLKEQTFKGRLIVVNIHQPSSEIYKLFDRLWLLDRGGYPVYDGNPIEAVSYFKQMANYADAENSMCPMCGNVNPEIVLNIIDAKMIDDSGLLTDQRKVTPLEWHNLYVQNRKEEAPVEELDIPCSLQKKPSALKQLSIFLRRNLKTKVTNVQYVLISLLEAPLLALIVSFLTRYAPPEGYSIMNNKNLVSYLFMAVIVVTFIGMSGSAEEIFKDKALLKREKFLRLSHSSYIGSKILFMAALSVLQTFLFLVVGNSVMGINFLFAEWWLVLFLSALVANLTGLLLSQSLNSIVAIYITIPLLLIPQILLCGLVVRFDDLTPNSKTGNVPLIGEVIPSRWAFEALAVKNFTSNPYNEKFFEQDRIKYGSQYYERAFLYELECQLEQANQELADSGRVVNPQHLAIIRNELPHLVQVTGLKPFPLVEQLQDERFSASTYSALESYFKKNGNALHHCNSVASREKDQLTEQLQREMGREGFLTFKKMAHNNYLNDLLTNAASERTHVVIGHTIVPRVAQVYLTPDHLVGRAPFYSSVKRIGEGTVETYWYNVAVLVLMALLTGGLLFLNIGHRMKKNKN